MSRQVPCPLAHAFLVLGLSVFTAYPAVAGPYDGNPKLLLHAGSISGKNACARGMLADCSEATTAGTMNTPCFIYLLAARGSLMDLAGLEVGVTYQNHLPGDVLDHQGLDIFAWTYCSTFEYRAPGANEWPRPGGSNLISWSVPDVCQTGPVAVAGYFYATAYSPDELRLIPRPVSGRAGVVNCAAVEQSLTPAALGSIAFGSAGCNSCLGPCPELSSACSVTPQSIDFGNASWGDWVTRVITVTNTGAGGLTHVRVSVDSPGFFLLDETEFELTSHQSRSFRVQFRASAYGTQTALVDLGSDCPPIPLTATVVPHLSCVIFPPEHGFGNVPIGESASRWYTLTNVGAGSMSGTINLAGADFSISGGVDYDLAPGEAHTFFIHFNPTRTGYTNCLISTDYCWTTANGTGGEFVPPVCQVTPAVLDFGPLEIGKRAVWSIQVRNLNPGCMMLNPQVSCSAFDWVGQGGQMNPCHPIVSVPVQIQFTPTEARAYECTVTPNSFCTPVILRGEGRIPGAGVLSPETLEFGSVSAGTRADRIVTLTNTGGTTIQGSLDEYCGEFAVAGNPEYSLPPGTSREFTIRFQPSALGDYRCVIDGGPESTVLPCTGNSLDVVSVESTTWGAIKARFPE